MKHLLSSRILWALSAAIALTGTAIAAGLFEGADAVASPTSLTIDARPVFWDPENPRDTKAGKLTYVGGLELTSEHPDFGGLSALIVGETGDAFIAVSDQGNWITADLQSDGDKPISISGGLVAPLISSDGTPFFGKYESDAEGLAVPRGADPRTTPILVSFERHHRIRRFDLAADGFEARAEPVPDFGTLANLTNNKGLEALTYLVDGSLLALSEETLDADGHIIGVRLTETHATPVLLRQHLPYMLTDLATLPNGDVVTLERHYSMLAGVSILMRRIPAASLEDNAPLDGEVLLEANNSRSIDNMEGLSIRQTADGTSLLYLISDNNFNPLQRTLLLVFALQD